MVILHKSEKFSSWTKNPKQQTKYVRRMGR